VTQPTWGTNCCVVDRTELFEFAADARKNCRVDARLADRLQTRAREQGYAWLNDRESVVVDVWWLEAEVNNGGFHLFFLNSPGDRAPHTIDALLRIGARRTAAILSEACAKFPGGVPIDRDDRYDLLEKIDPDNFSELDDRFLRYEEPIEALLDAFWKRP